MKHSIEVLVFLAIVFAVPSYSQNSYKIKLDRPAQRGDKYEYVAHYVSSDTMTLRYKQSGELFRSKVGRTTTEIKAAAEVIAVGMKGESACIQYTIGHFVQSKTEESEGVDYKPQETKVDTVVQAGTVLTRYSENGIPVFKKDGVAVSDSASNFWSYYFEDCAVYDMDKIAEWKKARSVGTEWKGSAKKLNEVNNNQTPTAKPASFDKSTFSFDSVFTLHDIPCAAVRHNTSLPLSSSSLPPFLLKALKPDTSAFNYKMGFILPLDSSLPESEFYKTESFLVRGTFRYAENTPEMTLLLHTEGIGKVDYMR